MCLLQILMINNLNKQKNPLISNKKNNLDHKIILLVLKEIHLMDKK
jgi:hypothetical protein